MTDMKPPPEGRNTGAPSLRGLQGRSATGLNGQAAKDEMLAVWSGLDAGKYFWRSGGEKCFSLDIPFYRTSGPLRRESVLSTLIADPLEPPCITGSSYPPRSRRQPSVIHPSRFKRQLTRAIRSLP